MTWRTVCPASRVPSERGVCVLIDGEQVALFRTATGSLHALDNRDPVSGAMVLARGIVGTRGATGECLDLDGVQVTVHEVAVHGGFLAVRLTQGAA